MIHSWPDGSGESLEKPLESSTGIAWNEAVPRTRANASDWEVVKYMVHFSRGEKLMNLRVHLKGPQKKACLLYF